MLVNKMRRVQFVEFMFNLVNGILKVAESLGRSRRDVAIS